VTRNLSIDTLRGLACVLLVAFHVVGSGASGLFLDSDHALNQVNNVLAYIRMPLFTFLSGFVYACRPYSGEPIKFLKGKVRRLLVPMLLVGTFFAMLQSITPGAHGGNYDWRLLHIIPVAHYWFLESLFILFMLTACLDGFSILSTPGRCVSIWFGAVLLFMFVPTTDMFGISGAMYLFPFFLLGLACKRFDDKLKCVHVLWVAVALLSFVLYLSYTNQALPDRAGLVAVLVSGGLCIALLHSHIQIRWLAWIGYFSFAIYLFHSMFSAASRIALLQLGVDSVAILFGSGMVLGILGPILVSAILQRVPLGNWVLGESSKRRHSPLKKLYAGPATYPINDTAANYSVDETVRNLLAIRSAAQSGGATVVIFSTQPKELVPEQSARLVQIDEQVSRALSPCFLPVREALAKPDGSLADIYNPGDGLHPNDAGHAVIRNRVSSLIDSGACASVPPG